MIILKRLFTISISLLALCACETGDNNLPSRPDDDDNYVGTMVVDQNDGTTYTDSAAKVAFEITAEGKANFKMFKVRFSEKMPLTLTMTVEGVTAEPTSEGYTLSGDGIVPLALGGRFEKYTITDLHGTLTQRRVVMSFLCGEYPVTYEGTK